jgi:predicted oxidoreductase
MAGLQLSPIVAGAWRMAEWRMTPQQRLGWIHACLERGFSSIDHADIYGGYSVEALFGEALALAPGLRERMQLVSKCGIQLVHPARPGNAIKHYDTSAAHVRTSVENSLKALGTDRLDLLLIHRPDALLDADELATCFEQLRRDGKVLHFGVSNFTPAQFELLHSRVPLATNQVECSPLHLEPLHDGTFDQAQRLRVPPMIWSPLAGGGLFTRQDEHAHKLRWVMGEVAGQLAVSQTTLALAWLMRLPCRPLPIVGSHRVQVLDEAQAALDIPLSAQDWYRVWTAAADREVA